MEDSILLHNDDKYEMQDENTLSVRQALTTKTAITFLLEGKLKTNVCRYCLNVDAPLSELDRIMHLAIKGVIYNVTIRDMIASFHPIKVADDPNFPTKICEICLEQTLSSYLFTQQCEKAERALRNCLEDIHDKTDKLDPLERTKKRGRQKLNPNYNIIHVEHEKVIDYAEPVINLVNTNTELQDETLKENKLNPHECAKCWQVFPNVPALLNHEKIHPTTMWFHCRICGRSFPKRIQLKRHLLSHAKHTEKTDIIEKFQCKNCGYKTNAYSAHLEHIEKHKFKTALQRLVNNKMDKICSVCLGEGHLANLDKMICLHGGEPGLSGDVSLFNVLGSIIPSKNQNKYQELHVLTQARIMKFVKKYSSTNSNVADLKVSLHFKLSHPIVISKQELTLNGNYLFTFSHPKKIVIEQDEIGFDNQNGGNKDFVTTFEKETDKDNGKVEFFFASPDFNIDVYTTNTNKDTNVVPTRSHKPCQKCWIFGKPCNDNILNEIEKVPAESCQYCWIFKNTKQCDFCKSKEIQITHNKSIQEAEKTKPLNSKAEDDLHEPKPKKAKWQCDVCLTSNNSDHAKCLCCDFTNDNTGFNFPAMKDSYKEKYNIYLEPEKDVKISEDAIEITDYSKTDNAKVESHINNVETENIKMDIELPNVDIGGVEIEINGNAGKPYQIEMMDFTEDSTNNTDKDLSFQIATSLASNVIPEPNILSEVSQIMPVPVFHIGSGIVSRTRKFKKPIRRIATSNN